MQEALHHLLKKPLELSGFTIHYSYAYGLYTAEYRDCSVSSKTFEGMIESATQVIDFYLAN